MDDEHIEVVEHFKYLGSLKSADDNWSRDARSRIGMAKKIRLDLVPIWRNRGTNKDLNMELVRLLVSSHLWRRMLDSDESRREKDRISITRMLRVIIQLLGTGVRHKFSFFWPHNQRWRVRAGEVCDSREVNWKRRRGRHKTSYCSNITKWMAKRNNYNYREISLDGEYRCYVRHGRLIITPDGIGQRKNTV